MLRIALVYSIALGLGALGCASAGTGASVQRGQYSTPAPTNQTPRESRPWDAAATESLRIPGGQQCLQWLDRLRIPHRRLKATAGMETPVEATGPIGGVGYWVHGHQSVTADCRLILALDWIGPHLRQFGVTGIRHSGAYVYRTTKSGRLSLHALGLALDVHGFYFNQTHFEVENHFQRDLDNGCHQGAPTLNQLECRLRALRLFRELITPDHNADHHDHFHLGIMPT